MTNLATQSPAPTRATGMGSKPSLPVLPATRKQNIACDQCRRKKIRCLRGVKTEICQQCKAKSSECTSDYIDSLEAARTRETKSKARKPSSQDDASDEQPRKKRQRKVEVSRGPSAELTAPFGGNVYPPVWHGNDMLGLEVGVGVSVGVGMESRMRIGEGVVSTYAVGESSAMGSRRESWEPHLLPDTQPMTNLFTPPGILPSNEFANTSISIPTPSTATEKQLHLLRYLFAPYPVLMSQYGYTDSSSIAATEHLWEEDGGNIWLEQPSEAHLSLNDDTIKELAEEMIENYLSIVNTRTPLHSPSSIRTKFSLEKPDVVPLPHALLAAMIAWGARFSDAPLIVRDAEQVGTRVSGQKGSRIVRLVIVRAREVVEANKAFRVGSLENAQALTLLQGVLASELYHEERHLPFYADCATNHLRALCSDSANPKPSGVTVEDDLSDEDKTALLCHAINQSNSTRAAKTDTSTIKHEGLRESNEQLARLSLAIASWTEESHRSPAHIALWLESQSSLASIADRLRCHSTSFTAPLVSQTLLQEIVKGLLEWRNTYLGSLGVPSTWPAEWDFNSAITSCATDISYHHLWLVLHRSLSLSDAGSKSGSRSNDVHPNPRPKSNDSGDGSGSGTRDGENAEVESLSKLISKVEQEAEHAALRIAALTAVLTENEYLRLDPLIIHRPIAAAGSYLAQNRKGEYAACLAGLWQYAQTFPAIARRADQLQALFMSVSNSESTTLAFAAVGVDDKDTGINDETRLSMSEVIWGRGAKPFGLWGGF